MCLGLIILVGITLYIVPKLPDIETLRDVRMQVPLRIYTSDHSLISEYGEKRRTPIEIKDVSSLMIKAFLAAEDDRFYQHPGVDWQGILRAAINLAKTGKKTQGGSTITMQVARNFFLSREKSYLRKINEIFLALKIEQELSKDEILELYLNKIYLGQRAYGVGAAAQVYYGSGIDGLNLPQIAMIAGLPKAPSTTNPVTNAERAKSRRNYVLGRMLANNYIKKQEYEEAIKAPVTASLHSPAIETEAPYIAEMVRKQLVDEYGEDIYSDGYKVFTTIRDKNQLATSIALRNALIEYDQRHGYRGPEHHFELTENVTPEMLQSLLSTFAVIGELKPAIIVEINDQSVAAHVENEGRIELPWAGFEWARKYIDENRRGPALQAPSDIFQTGDIVRVIKNENGQWKLSQIPEVEGGLVSVNPVDGSILALTGGFDFKRSKFNRITQALRQPGSSFKPFIYSTALEGGFTAASLINDAPIIFDDPGIEDIWRPENYSGRYFGPTRIREALRHSRNLVSIRMLNDIGVRIALNHIGKFGFDINQLPHNLSLALGSGAVTPWQLATAYCVMANGGFRVEPYFIERIETSDNKIIFQSDPLTVCTECEHKDNIENIDPQPADPLNRQGDDTGGEIVQPDAINENQTEIRVAERIIDPRNVWIMNSMLRDVIQYGTGKRARVLKRPDLAGKTGTTNDQRDAWFAGFNPAIVTVAWVGFDDFRQLGTNEVGGRAALPMWIEYMRIALEDIPVSKLDRPEGLVNAKIDPETGRLAKADNPKAIFEVFRSEHVPPEQESNTNANIFLEGNESARIPEQVF